MKTYLMIAAPGVVVLGILGVLLFLGDPAPSLAVPENPPVKLPDGCPEGSFCGRIEPGTGTACPFDPCCDGIVRFCFGDREETVPGWPNVLSANVGFCIVNGPEVDACELRECQGNDCEPGPCTPTGNVSFRPLFLPMEDQPCGGDIE